MKNRRTLFAVVCAVCWVCGVSGLCGGGEMLKNGGMEAPFVEGLAQGWLRNCYGENTYRFSEETQDVHSGRSAQPSPWDILDMMGNIMKNPALNPGEPVYVLAPRLAPDQLEDHLR